MRLSYPMPVTRSRTFAPTASHRPAIVLMNVSLVARNAFEAYLMSSEVVASVMTAGAPESLNNSATRTAASRSSAPTTTRSGLSESATAVPSLRNSGLETTTTSARPTTRSTRPTVPTGTVDLLTMIAPSARCGAISAAAAVTLERSADPSSDCGVSTQRKTNSAPCTASAARCTARRRPVERPSFSISTRPCSTMGERPWDSASNRRSSRSAIVTR